MAPHDAGGPGFRVDVHQHLWTPRLLQALAQRTTPPCLRRRGTVWELELAGEPTYVLPKGPLGSSRRLALLDEHGLDVAIIALSSALGIETLPDDEARELLAAFNDDADLLPGRLPAWGAVPLVAPDPADVDDALDRGRVGIALPATALATPHLLHRAGPLLDRLAARGAPLFVHPGPVEPGTWLAPLTGYVAQLSAAWHVWALLGRARHPGLRVVFAALAGLAPLHAERLAARVSDVPVADVLADRDTFYDTSSYGPAALEAILRVVPREQLVLGSDWPYATPVVLPDAALQRRVAADNPAALLGPAALSDAVEVAA